MHAQNYCDECGADIGMESHYHCGRCGEVCSMMGHGKYVDGKYVPECVPVNAEEDGDDA